MVRRNLLTLIFTSLLWLSWLLPVFPSEITYNTVVAKINDKEITIGNLILSATTLATELESLPDEYLLNAVLDQLIKQEVMSQSLQSESVRLKFTLENQIRAIRAAEAIEIELRDYPNDTDIRAEYKK